VFIKGQDGKEGDLCGVFCLSRSSDEENMRMDPEWRTKAKEMMSMASEFFVTDKIVREKYPQYFADKTRIASIHGMGVPPQYRGRGIASFMMALGLELARTKLGVAYLSAFMGSPETIHLAEKHGFKTLHTNYYDDAYMQRKFASEDGTFTPDVLERIAEF
jgi:ribosomal protein S18 acetylase RimI-like enzyme